MTPKIVQIKQISQSCSSRFALLTVLAFAARPAVAQVSAADSACLVETTQALLNAVTDGDSAMWARHLAPNWILSDEEGNLSGRAEFLAGLRPLAAGQSGKLTLSRWQLTGGPGVAVIVYDADEEHHYYGQLLLTRFHITDTYVRSGNQWQQLASQVTALPQPIAGAPLPARLGREYAGTYQLTPEIRMTVAAGDSGLTLERPGRPAQRLYALDDRLFIRHGVRGFWVFERDGSGAVTALVNWRDNNPVTWRRIAGRRLP
jgi:hypothetical protein